MQNSSSENKINATTVIK